jgi:hypothetical protein
MQALLDSLPFNGAKTYIIAVLTIIFAVSGMITGHLDLAAGSDLIAIALTGTGLRHALPAK